MKKLFIILALLLSITLFGCSSKNISAGYSSGLISSERETLGYVALKLENTEYDVRNPITVTFSYGHDIYDSLDTSHILGHKIGVFLTDEMVNPKLLTDSQLLYELPFEGLDFLVDENKCEVGSFLSKTIKFNQEFELDIDFSQLTNETGNIFIRIEEKVWSVNGIDDETVGSELLLYEASWLYFKIDGNSIIFSDREFN
ncbi:MAG: hypothetical protein A2084_00990 [Tenericutes bacterium GWC2_39_45]|nr:MAG: hypothetical protein A2084_00990 [Tenericutes bacterium GWC2_39_45]OHE40006.1 MAG: hypothetical protein A2013_03745 [Tenericutes bacterium GWE2_38_8]OHE45645.1 MAG: hypothetical protein A2102_03840 [Tenericutes bacterium GWF2_38_8]HBG32483.1 hypothetical protein [Acholeplasmataceae bacterium]HCB67404.1 hypothetical protein [Acholeplasmataceae bacterium]